MKVWIVVTVQSFHDSSDLYADILGVYATEKKAKNRAAAINKWKSEDNYEELQEQGAIEEFDTATYLEWEVE